MCPSLDGVQLGILPEVFIYIDITLCLSGIISFNSNKICLNIFKKKITKSVYFARKKPIFILRLFFAPNS